MNKKNLNIESDTSIFFSKGDIDMALKELDIEYDKVDWDGVKKEIKERAEDRFRWFLGEYEWDWLIDSIWNNQKKIIKKKDLTPRCPICETKENMKVRDELRNE